MLVKPRGLQKISSLPASQALIMIWRGHRQTGAWQKEHNTRDGLIMETTEALTPPPPLKPRKKGAFKPSSVGKGGWGWMEAHP